jgi:pimeloyl-ACP methyl ester carboxylesterase
MIYEPVRPPRHEELTVRGLKHRLTWWGEPCDTPIVLLHGFMDCGDTWQFLVDQLPRSWSLVAADWRGFGGTQWAAGGYWFPDYFADLEALLDTLIPGHRARVIGHSMGAHIASMYAGIRPQRLQWLANLEGMGLPRTRSDSAPGRYAQWLDELEEPPHPSRYESVEQLATVLNRRNPRLTLDRARFVARAWTRAIGGEVRLAFDPCHRRVNPVLYRLEEAEACWRRMEIPMLLIMGGSSDFRERGLRDCGDDYLKGLFRHLRSVTLPHEDPQAVATPIIEFEREHS